MLSKDLQVVTNALWEAGAEAISINGQRLTARSAIRFAGDAILVNYRPLTRPYVISAIGDPQNLQVEFADNEGGSYVRALEDNYGVRVTMAGAKKLTLPGAPALTVRNATKASAPPTGTPSTTGTPAPPTRPRPRRSQHSDTVLGLIGGILIGLFLQPEVPLWLQPYLPIAVIAALDAVFGAVRAVLDGIFNDKVFVVSFLANVVVAGFIVFLGDQLGVGSQLSTGVVVVLGVRIFSNVASIRRHLFRA